MGRSARHFCFCLPLRLGALLISLCQLILGGLLAAANWYTLESMRGRLPRDLRGTIVASSLYYTLLSIAALIGLFGAIGRNPDLLSTYAYYLARTAGLQIVIDIAQLIVFFKRPRETLVQNCIDGSTDETVQNICDDEFNVSKWSILVSMIIGLVIQFWAAYIVASYAESLLKGESWRSGPGIPPVRDATSSKYTHASVQEQDDHGAYVPLTSANASDAYPFAAKDSFGGSTPHHHTATSV